MLDIKALGTAEIDAGEVRLTPNSIRKFALMLYLSAHAGRRASRSTLQDLVFPDSDAKSGRHSLRELVYQFRRGGVPLVTDSHGVELVSDAVRFDYVDLIEAARPTPAQLRAAEGGFLPGYAPTHSEAFAEWLDAFRADVSLDLCKACLKEMGRARTAGDWSTTERAARACLAIDPLNEEATLALAEMLAISGSKAKALTHLDRFIEEVGSQSADLKIPAVVLRRRISERFIERTSPRRLSPFVGREREMELLGERFDSALGGQPHCVVVSGDAGIGKTRLVTEFASLAMLRGANLSRTAAQPHDVHRPLGAFVDLVPSLLRLPGALGCSPAAIESLRRLTTHDADLTVPIPSSPEIEALEFAISRAIADLVDAVANERPLVLIVDDAQWLDRPSQQALSALSLTARTRRVLVLVTTREPRAASKAFYHPESVTRVPLRELSVDSSQQLADWALGTELENRPHLSTRVVAASAGNPFFLIALGSHNGRSSGELEVPESVRTLLSGRLATLDNRAMAVLQTCASLGRHSTIERLVDALDLPQIDLLSAVAELCEKRFVDEEGGEVKLAHPLIVEALRETTFGLWRKVAAYRVARILQSDAERLRAPGMLWDCAEQWRHAGEHERALTAIRACARHSIETGRPLEAAKMLAAGLDLPSAAESRVAAAHELILAASAATEYELIIRGADVVRSLSGAGVHDDAEIAELDARFRTQPESVDQEERALACVAAPDASPEHRAQAAIALLKYAESRGRADLMARLDDLVNQSDFDAAGAASNLEYMLIRLTSAGSAVEAVHVAAKLRRLADDMPLPKRLPINRSLWVALVRAGRVDEAREVLEQTHALAEQLGATRARFRAEYRLAALHDIVMRHELVDAWLSRASETAVSVPGLASDTDWALVRIDVLLNRNDHERAAVVLAEAIELDLFAGDYLGQIRRVNELRIRSASGALLSDDLALARRLAADTSSFMSGLRDLEIGVACLVLAKSGAASEAAKRLRRYLKVERSRFVRLNGVLREACEVLHYEPKFAPAAELRAGN